MAQKGKTAFKKVENKSSYTSVTTSTCCLRREGYKWNRHGEKVRKTGFGNPASFNPQCWNLSFLHLPFFQLKWYFNAHNITIMIIYNYYYNLCFLPGKKEQENLYKWHSNAPGPVISGKFNRYSWATWFTRFQNLHLILLQAPLIMWGRNMVS